VWWARKVFDSQRLEHKSPLDIPLFLASCAGHLGDRDRQGEERCMQGPLSKWTRRPEDGIRYVA
jgi:hypothetical protein